MHLFKSVNIDVLVDLTGVSQYLCSFMLFDDHIHNYTDTISPLSLHCEIILSMFTSSDIHLVAKHLVGAVVNKSM